MSSPNPSAPIAPGRPSSPILVGLSVALVLIGLGTFAALLATGHEQRAWSALLQGLVLPTWITIGALFFIAVHSVVNARWTIPLRRVMEGLTSPIWLTIIGFIAIAALGAPYLYEWASGEAHFQQHHAEVGITKAQWMQPMRWIITSGIGLVLWLALRHRLIGLSLRQDTGTDIAAAHTKTSVFTLLIVAPTFTLFVWDLLLSLHVAFASTMWGVYCFTGAVQTFLAVLVLAVLWLRRGPLAGVINKHTLHDLGTWTMVWGIFCTYIGFAQYLVIYFANMDEEVAFLLPRLQHGYGAVYVGEALLRALVPFVLLMSQSLRTKPIVLATVAIAVLIGNWMDWSWIIMPAFSPNEFRPFWSPAEIAIGLGFAGASLLLALRFWRKHGVVAVGDPNLTSTVNGEHL